MVKLKNVVTNKRFILAILALFVIVLITALYYSFFAAASCDNYSCFQYSMKTCSRAKYINNQTNTGFYYKINGVDDYGRCSIYVELIDGKDDLKKLVGLDMICSYPKGYMGYPQQDLAKCHGKLKEGIQGIMIDKLQTNLIGNLDSLNNLLNS